MLKKILVALSIVLLPTLLPITAQADLFTRVNCEIRDGDTKKEIFFNLPKDIETYSTHTGVGSIQVLRPEQNEFETLSTNAKYSVVFSRITNPQTGFRGILQLTADLGRSGQLTLYFNKRSGTPADEITSTLFDRDYAFPEGVQADCSIIRYSPRPGASGSN